MKSKKFFINILAVFFVLVKPASTRAKPGCIKNTSMAASNIHTVSNDNPTTFVISVVSIQFLIFS